MKCGKTIKIDESVQSIKLSGQFHTCQGMEIVDVEEKDEVR